MAAKKKKRLSVAAKAEFNRRSKAAKRGWKKRKARVSLTRRFRVAKKRTRAIRSIVSTPTGKAKKKGGKGKEAGRKKVLSIISDEIGHELLKAKLKVTEDELERLRYQVAQAEMIQKRLAEIEATWSSDIPLDRLSVHGGMALEPSRLRMRPDAGAIHEMMHMDHGDMTLDEVMQWVADKYDVTIREAWTLYYSP